MRAYADSSFLVKLVSREPDSAAAMAEYRRLDYPPLFFLPLHALEVRNAILQRAFHQRRSAAKDERRQIAREKAAAQFRLEHLLQRRAFVDVAADWEIAVSRARQLSDAHTERTGARSYDLLHVAFALELECEVFFTADERQAKIAKAEGLKVVTALTAD